ncbi:unnamed protein product [Phaeothamnion confervicola]
MAGILGRRCLEACCTMRQRTRRLPPAFSSSLLRKPDTAREYSMLRVGGALRRRVPVMAPPARTPRRSMFIQTETTPNPNSLKFMPGQLVLPESHGSGMYFTKGDRDARQSPLASKVLALDGVMGVFLGRDFISVTKAEDEKWPLVKPIVFGAIMDFYAEGKPAVLDEPVVSDTTILDTDDEVVAMIKELLEERIRPAVQEDGGDIFFRGFDAGTGKVKLQLAGSCSGCPSSSVTLRSGVENMLKHYIPEVTGVEEVEDTELREVNEREVSTLEARLRQAGVPYSD